MYLSLDHPLYLAYVSDIYEQLVTTPRKELEKIGEELKEENLVLCIQCCLKDNPDNRFIPGS
jgi:hypothetical protein